MPPKFKTKEKTGRVVEALRKLTGSKTFYQVFGDWIEMAAIAIQNQCCLFHDDIWEYREERYKTIINSYEQEKRQYIFQAFGELIDVMDDGFDDVLSEVLMMGEMGNKEVGQFFTPFNVALMTAGTRLTGYNGEKIVVNEPSCGGGGMILAAAKIIQEKGYDPQQTMIITAQDLDYRCVYMTYIMLSLYGLKAKCIQGDTLSGEEPKKRNIWYTPKYMGVII